MYRFVVIDDEFYFRQSLKKIVNYNDYGFEFVGEARNGQLGYDLIFEVKPDLVLVDINMPVMNGLELIEKCYNDNIDCKFVLITGYAEFEYAQKALQFKVSNYLLKPINTEELIKCLQTVRTNIDAFITKSNNLNKTLNQNKFLIRNAVFGKLINGYYDASDEDITDEVSRYFVPCFNNFFVTLVICDETIPTDIFESIAIDQTHILAFYTPGNQLCIITNYDNKTELPQIIDTLYKSVKNFCSSEFKLFIGRAYGDILSILHSYNEALLTQQSKENYSQEIVSYSNINENYTTDLFSDVMRHKIIHSMSESDSEQTTMYIAEVFNNCRHHNASYNTIALVAINLINTIFVIALKYSMDEFMTMHSQLINMIISTKRVDVLESEIKKVSSDIIHHIPVNELPALVLQIIDYVSENYKNEDLNIKYLSEELHTSYSYICAVFKDNMTMTLNNYISEFRLKKAKELFDNGSVNVTMASYDVGYKEVSYFSKCFKKKYGLSPKQYIENFQQ